MATDQITESAQYLTFTLAEEVYAVNVTQVQEVLEYVPITKVPRTPNFMRGVINVRGSVVPVLDLRLKFDMEQTQQTVDTCIVVMEIAVEGESQTIGALADSVQEVVSISPESIEPSPKIGTQIRADFIKGMGKQDDHFVMILDIDRVFSSEELVIAQEATNAPQAAKTTAGPAEEASSTAEAE